MRRLFAFLVILFLAGAGLYYWKYRPAGETPRQALGAVGEKIRAAKTTGEVRAALELNRNVKPYPIEVDVTRNGVVVLRGEVPREDFRAEAQRVVAAVPDVREVRNEIRINPALPPPDEGGRTLGENFDDKALEAKVKLAGETTDVIKVNDEVQLRGQAAASTPSSKAAPAAVPGDRAQAAGGSGGP